MDPLPAILVSACIVAWAVLVWLSRVMLDNPREDVPAGLFMLVVRLYVRVLHRLKVEGLEHVPRERWGVGPLVVVSNHTAGVDPLLIQTVCRFEVKFMMAADMQMPALAPLWDFTGVIPVNREGGDLTAARAAIRHLRDGGVVGIFPEGRIVRERGVIGPFIGGFGLMIRKSGARVLPVTIQGTPVSGTAFGSLFQRSRSVVRFHPVMSFADTPLPADAIVEAIRERMLEETGWVGVGPEALDARGFFADAVPARTGTPGGPIADREGAF